MVQCLGKDLGVDVNQEWQNGTTPNGATHLCVAAARGQIDVARCLDLEFHADVNKGDRAGATPLYVAAQQGNLAMVRALVNELGAVINKAAVVIDFTPLMQGTSTQRWDVVCWLVKGGADTQAFVAAKYLAMKLQRRLSRESAASLLSRPLA